MSANLVLNCGEVRKDGVRSCCCSVVLGWNVFHESKPKRQPVRMWKLRDFPGPGATTSGVYTVLDLRTLHNCAQAG